MSELAQVNRIATAGQLSASIAHEINQPLTAIVANGYAGVRLLSNAAQSWRSAGIDPLPQIVANRVQLQQVILNLVMNAIEAMSSVTDRPRVLRHTTRSAWL
jgi:C4-dicarboxylate-specific signal transduction histidine kinase